MRAVNLLTPDQRSTPSGKVSTSPSAMEAPGGIGAFVLLGALALCLAGLAGYVLSNNVVKERTVRLAEVTAQSKATVAKAGKLQPYADYQTLAQERAGTVQALASARFDWEQAMRDLSRAMPSNVYVSTLKGTVGGGAVGSGIRGAIPSPAFELGGCTSSQRAVASLMSRLRNVQGVTRVSLAKSDTSGASGAAQPGTVNPCGKGAPPTFEMVVFFEGATVDAALAGATGAAPAGGAEPATATKQAKDGAAAASPTPAATTGEKK